MIDKDEEKLEDEKLKGYINPLDLIATIFWGFKVEDAGPEIAAETMTTAEVMAHLKTNRAQLARWSASGQLKPVSRGKYDATAVRSFVPPVYRKQEP